MTIHFRLNDSELRPLGRSARGVKSMNLKSGDSLVSMDVLSTELADHVDKSEEDELHSESSESEGPWVLVASASGLGKRVPMTQFRLQKKSRNGVKSYKIQERWR